jgi:hypothetical protein
MKKIAIWSPLRYANYGDDLQAIVFGLYVKSLGYEVILYQLDQDLAKQYDFDVANTVDELCKDVNLCIIAGGALLTPFILPKRILNRSAAEYEQDFKDLYKAVEKYNTKFCAISIGGDGIERNPSIYYSKHRINFFKSPNFLNGTVRLVGDIKQMKKFNKDFIYIPDCLLQSPRFLNVENKNLVPTGNRIQKIGINFKKGRYLSKSFMKSLYDFAANNPEIEFYFTTTHMDKTGISYEYLPQIEKGNIKITKYENPTQLLEFISEMDLFITSKLHLGITGLTVGTPFLSYRGPGKAKSFLRSIGGDWAILDDNVSFEELAESFLSKSKSELYNQYNITELEKTIEDSYQQFSFCKNVIEKYS